MHVSKRYRGDIGFRTQAGKRWASMARVALVALSFLFGPTACGGSNPGKSDTSAEAADTTAPVFAGATSAAGLGETEANVTWDPATDDQSPEEQIVYRVYGSDDGTFDFSRPLLVTPAGATSAVVSGLDAGRTHTFVVHAVDGAGNEDDNTVEVTATTTDSTPPVFGGVESVTATGNGTLHVEWQPASDNSTPASEIRYQIFVSTTQGDHDFSTPTVETEPGATSADVTVTGDATTYFVVVRAVDAGGHSDQNHKELSNTTLDGTPPVFAGITSAAPHGTAITLSWTAASDNVSAPSEIRYNVYAKNGSASYDFSTPTVSTQPGDTTQTLVGLDVSTTYDFVVRATDAAGNEDTNTVERSATTGASADTTAPTFGGVSSASAINATWIQLGWNAASDDVSDPSTLVYDIFVADASGAQDFSAPSYTTAPGATSFLITGLAPVQQIYVVVRARDQSGNEDANVVELTATTDADTKPPTFRGVGTLTATGPSSVQVSWNAASDDTTSASQITYAIFFATSSGGQTFATPTLVSAAGQTAAVVNGLSPNTQYYVVVRAVDAYGNSDSNTDEKAVTTDSDTTAPTFAGAASATALTKTSIRVDWNAASDDATPADQLVYDVCVSQTAGACGSSFVVAATTAAGATSYTATNLTAGTRYYVVVRARDASGNSDPNTVEKSAATNADTQAPAFGGATSLTGATTSSLTVTWAPATDDTTPAASIKYFICMSTTAGQCKGSGFTTTAQLTGTTSRQFTGLAVNTEYCFVVRAEDSSGNRDANDVEQCGMTSADTTPPTFSGVTAATPTSDTSVSVSWAAGSDNITAAGQLVYDVCRTTVSGGCSGTSFSPSGGTSPAGATSLSVTALTPNTTYYFVVRARDQAGNTDGNDVQISAKTDPDTTPPSSPLSASVDNATFVSLRVNWQAASDDATAQANLRYRVCVTETSSCTTTAAGATNTTVSGLDQGTTYHFQITALDQANNESAAPATAQGTTVADTTPPTWNGGPVLTVAPATPTQMGVTWTAATDNLSSAGSICYDICWSSVAANCTGSSFDTNAVNAGCGVTTYPLSGLTTRTTYYVALRARDGAGNAEAGTHSASKATPTSYAADVLPKVFNADSSVGGCQGFCHGTTSGDWTRADAVNVFSTAGYTDTAACGGKLYLIKPGSPEESYLFRKMLVAGITTAPFSTSCPNAYSGGQMPCTGNPPPVPPTATQVSIMQDWITDGALDN